MQTIVIYKVCFVDEYGDIQERDFQDEVSARNYAQTKTNSQLFKTAILGQIEELTI